MTKARDTSRLVSSQTGIAVMVSGDPVVIDVGNIGIGTTNATGKITSATTSDDNIELYRYYAGSNGPVIRMSHSYSDTIGGNELIPGSGGGYSLGRIDFRGSLGSGNWGVGGRLKFIAKGSTSASSLPTDCALLLTPSGSTTPSEVVRVSAGGSVGIGTDNPQADLHCDGTLKLGGTWLDAPVGTPIKTGVYNTGYGSGARTTLSTTTYTTLNINGTGQQAINIERDHGDDVIVFNKVSSNSHLAITLCMPFYQQASGTDLGNGFGIQFWGSYNDGSSFVQMSNISNGVVDYWGGGGYGGHSAGVFTYTWHTAQASNDSDWLARTGDCRFYWKVRCGAAVDTLYFIDYAGSYPKEGTITITEFIAQ